MTPEQAPEGWHWLAALAAAVPAIALAWSKFARSWSADRRAQFTDEAAGEVVVLMRQELERVQRHNKELVAAFEQAQLRIIELAKANQHQQAEIEALKATIEQSIRQHTGRGV